MRITSVTCALCGELADERRTTNLDPEAQYEAAPEDFSMIGRIFVARHLFGSGEAHQECLRSKLLDHIADRVENPPDE